MRPGDDLHNVIVGIILAQPGLLSEPVDRRHNIVLAAARQFVTVIVAPGITHVFCSGAPAGRTHLRTGR